MEPEPKHTAPSRLSVTLGRVFLVLGLLVWFLVRDALFPRSPGTVIDWTRALAAGAFAGGGAALGHGLGWLVDRRRRGSGL